MPRGEAERPPFICPNSCIQSEAESCYHKAIEVARQQNAKSLELRATIRLACLWKKQERWKEAQQTLAEICHWFTEGFDTVDLQKAESLLEELSGGDKKSVDATTRYHK